MAMFSISGRMSVKTVKKNFNDAFGGNLHIMKDGKPADEGATMASLRAEGCKGGELELKGNTKVAGMKKKMAELYGITVEVFDAEDKKAVDDGLTLASTAMPQVATPAEKPAEKKEPHAKPAKELKEKSASKAAPDPVPAQPTAVGFSFNELLDAALADGELTDKERSILIKKATAQGLDPDEVEMVIDGRLAKMKQLQQTQTKFPEQIKEPEPAKAPEQNADEPLQILGKAWNMHKFGDDTQAIKSISEYVMNNTLYSEIAYLALFQIYKESGKYNEARKFGILFFYCVKSRLAQPEGSTIISGKGIRNHGLGDLTRASIFFKTDFNEMLVNMCEELFRSRRKNEAIRFLNENEKYLVHPIYAKNLRIKYGV